jgi:hypothetical protein
MPLANKLLAAAAPALLLALNACTTGLPTKVSRFQAMPAPQGQSFIIEAANPRNQGGIEFSHYAGLVRDHLLAQGYSEATSPQSASLIVSLDYGVDNGQTEVRSYPSFGYGRYGYGWGSPFWGRRSAFHYGWYDPWLFPSYDIDSYTVFTSYLDMDIRRAADGQSVFEGLVRARSRSDELQQLVPPLVQAMFTGFPGRSGETVRITVPPPPRG